MTIKLSDMQLILLTAACQREDGSMLPPSENLGNHTARIRKAVTTLIKLGLAEEREGAMAAQAWREDGDLVIGVIITDAGRAVIEPQVEKAAEAEGVVEPEATAESEEATVEPEIFVEAVAEPMASATRPPTKQSMVIDMLKGNGGTTLTDIVNATGWLPHTSRAALTGLRKKGHAIVTAKVEGKTRYHIDAVA